LRDKRLWLFNTADLFSGNPKWLFLYMAAHRPDIEVVWISDSADCVRLVRKLGFRAVTFASAEGRRLQDRAGVLVVNQVKEKIPRELTGVILLNLWHGVGVKAIERRLTQGALTTRIARKYITNNVAYHSTQQFLVTSPFMEAHFIEQVGLEPDQLVRGSYPQNIYARRFGAFASFDHDLLRRKGLPAATQIAVYAPTYRTHHRGTDFLRDAFPDPARLLEALADSDTLLILKMHPRMEKDAGFQQLRSRYGDHPRLLFWDNRDDIYEVFPKIDLAIVDYSSIHYDLLAAGVSRFIRYAFDMDAEGVLEHAHDYLSLSAGTLARDFDSLVMALGQTNEIAQQEHQHLTDAFWAYDADDTFERLVQAGLEREPRQVDLPTLYSFDVFDTLIGRTTVVPQGVFHLVRERMLARPDVFAQGFSRDFVRARQQAEAAERDSRRRDPRNAATKRFEITFDGIYARLGRLFDLDANQIAMLQGWEIDAERLVTRGIPDQIERVKRLKAQGDTIVLISDMYLPEDVVRELLILADPELGELPLYLSSTWGVQKSTGALYLEAYHSLPFDHREWRHFGDNPRADKIEPQKLGIRARQLPATTLSAYERAVTSAIDSYDGFLIGGMLRSHRLGEDAVAHSSFAYSYVSTYLVPYVIWLVEDASRRGYETLYFLSRDGHHLKRIADAAIAELGLPLKTKYIYGSRAAWRFAAQVEELDEELFGPFGSFAGARSVSDFARIMRLDVPDFAALEPLAAHTPPEAHLPAAKRAALVDALRASASARAHILSLGREDRRAASGYLSQEIDFSERFAVAEYWGRGYTQDCFQRIVRSTGLTDKAVPFYYARSIYATSDDAVRHNYTAGQFSMLLVEAVFANLDHGSVESYVRRGQTWEPVTSPRENDHLLHDALERELPQATRDMLRLPLTDRSRSLRRLFTFGFDYFAAHPEDPTFLARLAPLRDAVVLGEREREFAPALTFGLFLRYLDRDTRGAITSNWRMTSARTRGLVRLLLLAQKRFGFRRILRAVRRQSAPQPAPSAWLFDDELMGAPLERSPQEVLTITPGDAR
jgi:CDP-glycerol glycerophosphotransferase (TagB/SpsB family)/FMN phosphatase YigB (HAD superfamily)